MQRNFTNKGNAEWQELNKPRQPEKVKLRLTPLDVYSRQNGDMSWRSAGLGGRGGKLKSGK